MCEYPNDILIVEIVRKLFKQSRRKKDSISIERLCRYIDIFFKKYTIYRDEIEVVFMKTN